MKVNGKPIKSVIRGAINIPAYMPNDVLFLIKVPVPGNKTCRDIYCKVAKAIKTYRNTCLFKYLDNTEVSLPMTSDRILGVIRYVHDFPSKPFRYNLVGDNDLIMWNNNADFTTYEDHININFEGVLLESYLIYDPMYPRKLEPTATPMYPRFEVGEIFSFHSREGKDYFAQIENVTKDMITLGCGKLEVPAYRIKINPEDKLSDDPNRLITIKDLKTENGVYTFNMMKLSTNVQSDLRRKLFDPFYRYGGI